VTRNETKVLTPQSNRILAINLATYPVITWVFLGGCMEASRKTCRDRKNWWAQIGPLSCSERRSLIQP